MKSWKTTIVMGCAVALLGMVVQSEAASVRVRCEKTSTRSRISVDGSGLAARSFHAMATSGANSATSQPKTAVGGQAEFDFDSNPADINAGATPISPNFIQGGQVTGKILNANNVVKAQSTVFCRVR